MKYIITLIDKISSIDSSYNDTTGVSTVTIFTDFGVFTGIARLHPDDRENLKSRYAGCDYALLRAYKKYFKALRKCERYAVKDLQNQFNCMPKRKKWVRGWLEENIKSHNEKIAELTNYINSVEEEIATTDARRSNIPTTLNIAKKHLEDMQNTIQSLKAENKN